MSIKIYWRGWEIKRTWFIGRLFIGGNTTAFVIGPIGIYRG